MSSLSGLSKVSTLSVIVVEKGHEEDLKHVVGLSPGVFGVRSRSSTSVTVSQYPTSVQDRVGEPGRCGWRHLDK